MPTPTVVTPGATKRMIDQLLDKGYQKQAGAVLRSVSASVNDGVMKARFKQLNEEMKRLEDNGEKLQVDNPVLKAFLVDYSKAVKNSARAIDGAAPGLQESAVGAAEKIVKQLALPGFSPPQIAKIWNNPDPEAIARVVNFTDGAGWKQRLAEYTAKTVQQVQETAIRGILAGRSPLAIGREVAGLAENMPLYQAQSMMRTLQLTSYRSANQAYGLANADILSHQVRIAALDNRTCMACVALHGTPLDIGERVDDHEQGRCTSVYVVNGRSVTVETGKDWFERQPESVQQQMMGPAAYQAYKANDVSLKDFVHKYEDAAFGSMVREASLTGMLGQDAQKYLQGKKNVA